MLRLSVVHDPDSEQCVELEELGAVSNCKNAARREQHTKGTGRRKQKSGVWGKYEAILARPNLKFHFDVFNFQMVSSRGRLVEQCTHKSLK